MTPPEPFAHKVRVAAGAVPARAARDPAIDLAKGWAILCVLLIHSDALHGNAFFRHVVNQAVPVFVVLFGVNAAFWWQRRDPRTHLREWYVGRLERILVPVWAMLPLWWALALWFRPFGVTLGWKLPLLHAAGYLLHIGTGWFVTMILQLVLLQPVLEIAVRRIGPPALLAVGVLVTTAITSQALEILGRVGMFNYWIISPRFLAHVTFGMLLAPHVRGLDWRAALAAGAVLAVAGWVQEMAFGPVLGFQASWVGALALTVVLLVVLRPVARVPLLGPGLEWLGQSSYGIYIGQLIVHNACVYGFGVRQLYERVDRWLYTAVLLAGGIAFTLLGEELRRRLAQLRSRPPAAVEPVRAGARGL